MVKQGFNAEEEDKIKFVLFIDNDYFGKDKLYIFLVYFMLSMYSTEMVFTLHLLNNMPIINLIAIIGVSWI